MIAVITTVLAAFFTKSNDLLNKDVIWFIHFGSYKNYFMVSLKKNGLM